MHVSLKNNPLADHHLQSLHTVDHSHKASASLAVEIILEPFDLFGFYANEGKILLFNPLLMTGTLGLGPAVMIDGWVVSSAAPVPTENTG